MKLITEDTIGLLKECSKGVKMGIAAIDGVMEDVKSDTLKLFLKESKQRHTVIGRDVERLLKEADRHGEEPPVMAKMMSWAKINFKMAADPTDKEAASLVYDGCNMGIKSLYEYLNAFKEADSESQEMAYKIINEEEELKSCLRNFI